MAAAWAQYKAWAEPLGRDILNWCADDQLFTASGAVAPGKSLPTQGWPLADFPTAFAIAIAYLAFVVIGSIVMQPLPSLQDLTFPMRFVYNLMQVGLCSYVTIEAGILAYRNNYSLTPCNAYSDTNPPVGPLLWLFYVSKVFDFFDTLFIVLGKKWTQLSFLHVYHHLTIFMFYWINCNIGYDGDIYLTILLNGFIHSVMYTYYFVSMHTSNIWWKKHLTKCQLLQFCCMLSQAGYLLHVQCKTFPKRVTEMYLAYIASLFFLFMHFYIRSYRGAAKAKADKKAAEAEKKGK